MCVGQAHDRTTDFVPGALATFCPACPQLGINIPPEWEWKHDESLKMNPMNYITYVLFPLVF
jgi:hypothetical protein